MDTTKLNGMLVMDRYTNAIGRIVSIRDSRVFIDFHGSIETYPYPSAFLNYLELEDEDLQKEFFSEGLQASFADFKKYYTFGINSEIEYLKSTGGKRYRIVDGERLSSPNGEYLYAFDSDTDFHFPDGTAIKLWFPESIVSGYVVACEDFTLIIRTMEFLGESIESVEFTSEQWQLLEALVERLGEMAPSSNSLAYQVACNGRNQISRLGSTKNSIICGQNAAFNRATSENITFIWGPPGTGKTETLANVALEHIQNGNRVLMLSYSNVSVDGAVLRVAKKADYQAGTVIRYGYPRNHELLNSKTLTSYQFVLNKNTAKAQEYRDLIEQKKKLKKKAAERIAINKKINRIRDFFLDAEKELIQSAAFVATTASKATVDRAIYTQNFDVVIFDEASMAYVPQIVFAAGLAKKHFICMGDFCQLPAIVQNQSDDRLSKDIFEHVGITSAVNNHIGHEWLVMLDMQYRMHPDIAEFVSSNMYHGRLKTSDRIVESRSEIAECSPCSGAAMSCVDLSGFYSVCTKTMDKSRINIFSALVCLSLTEKNISSYEVGIITPYSAQSRLILSMIRDIQERDDRWNNVSCATVHQFQGSEKPIIIYDAVDCFRMPYPGMLLTSQKNDSANRLFNVAITRAKGKVLLVANFDYLMRKKLSSKLLFTKALKQNDQEDSMLSGDGLLYELSSPESKETQVYFTEKEPSWKRFIEDVRNAKSSIYIDIPDVIDGDEGAIEELGLALEEMSTGGVEVRVRCPEEIDLPVAFEKYMKHYQYVTNPVTIIDRQLLWFGQPLYAADFITEGEILSTEFFPCVRFLGKHTARSVLALLEK